MKRLFLLGILAICLQNTGWAQLEYGISAGGNMYWITLNDQNISSPVFPGITFGGIIKSDVFSRKLVLEVNPYLGTQFTAGNFRYRNEAIAPEPDSRIFQLNNQYYKNNYFTFNLPLIIQVKTPFLQPFVGGEIYLKVTEYKSGNSRYIFAAFNTALALGFDLDITPEISLRLRYSLGLGKEWSRNNIICTGNFMGLSLRYVFSDIGNGLESIKSLTGKLL